MKTWLLVIILGLNPDWASNGETHVAVIVPDEETCEELRDAYVHAVDIRWSHELANRPDAPSVDFSDPFVTLEDVRKELEVQEVRCESATNDS